MANGVAGGDVATLLKEVTQSARLTRQFGGGDLYQVLCEIEPHAIVGTSPAREPADGWVRELEALVKEAQSLLAQAVAWEQESEPSLHTAFVQLTRPKWCRRIERVTERIKGVQLRAGLERRTDKEKQRVLEEDSSIAAAAGSAVAELEAGMARVAIGGGQEPGRVHNVLECWKGWYEQTGLKSSVTATLFLTSGNRLLGYGEDYLGSWTWEGEYVGVDQIVLRKQYVLSPYFTIQYSGTRVVKEGKEVLEGTWSIPAVDQGPFFFEMDDSAVDTAHGQLWSGSWNSGTDERRWTNDTKFVFTSDNRLFGSGSENNGERVTFTGTYYQEGSVLKITGLKLCQPSSPCSKVRQFWGEMRCQDSSPNSLVVVMEGQSRIITGETQHQGRFCLESSHVVFRPSTTTPNRSAVASGVAELEAWEGWHQQYRQLQKMSAHAFLMDNIRPCGFGLDSVGEWTWEGDFVDEDRMMLRKQYVNNLSYRLLYDGIRTADSGEDMIRGLWAFADIAAILFEPEQAQKFCLIKAYCSDGGTATGYGQHWSGHRQEGSWRTPDGGALVLTSTFRIFGYGSDVQGTYTYLGKYSRQGQAIHIRMVKMYEPGRGSGLVQYRGQVEVGCLPAATTVMQGSWTSEDGSSSGSFRFQTQGLDLDTFVGGGGLN